MQPLTKEDIELEVFLPPGVKIRGTSAASIKAALESEAVKELLETVRNSTGHTVVEVLETSKSTDGVVEESGQYPQLSGNLGVTSALEVISTSQWLTSQPRTAGEISECFKTNGILCARSQVSDRLVKMTRQGKFRRMPAGDGYVYGRGANAPAF